jgi:hypothetical protein
MASMHDQRHLPTLLRDVRGLPRQKRGMAFSRSGFPVRFPGPVSWEFEVMTVNPQLGPTTELTTCKGLIIHYKVFFIILTI